MRYDYVPSFENLRSSLRYRSKEYLLENTLHGVPYFIDSSRPKWERVMWFVLTMASVGMTIGVNVTIWSKFQTKPTLTALDKAPRSLKLEFPQILACYDWPQLNHSALDKSQLHLYEQLYNWSWGNPINLEPEEASFLERDDLRRVFHSVLPDCEAMFADYTLSGTQQLSTGFTRALTTVGACCRFVAPRPFNVTNKPWEFVFSTTVTPVRFYMLNPTDLGPIPAERPIVKLHGPALIQYASQVTLSSPNLRLLSRKQRNCEYRESEFYVSVNNCELEHIARKLLHRCGCLPWFMPHDGRQCPVSRYPCMTSEVLDLARSTCMLGCDNVVFYPVKVERAELFKVRLDDWPEMAQRIDTRFGYLDLVTSFGGIAGLFLGYSLLTSVEGMYYFSLRTYCGAVLDSSRKRHNIVTVHVAEPKIAQKKSNTDDDTTVYYDYVD